MPEESINCCCGMFDGDPSAELIIDGEIAALDMSEDGEAGVVLRVSDYSLYDGAYEITPTDNVQILETAEKLLKENVVVQPIPQNYGHISFNGYSLKVY